MSAYSPQTSVTIGGTVYDGQVLNNVRIITGRTSVDEQPRAGYATIQLVVTNDKSVPIKINDLLYVTVVKSDLTDPRIFTGYVSDITRRVQGSGPIGQVTIVDIIATGPLARLHRRASKATYPKQYDGDRIADILQDVFTTEWSEVTPLLTWASVPATTTWATVDTGYAGNIDTPGDYELFAYSDGAVESSSLAQAAADSALGVLYEDVQGLINYDSISTRVGRVTNDGYLKLDANYLTPGMQTSTKASQIANSITITYKSNASVTLDDVPSIAEYGLFGARKNTQLELKAQAEQQLELLLNTRSQPREYLETITIHLHNPDLPDATRDALIAAYCGMPVAIDNLPASITSYGFAGFIEGISWQATRDTLTATFVLSDYALSAVQQTWAQVSGSELWTTLNATMDWENARTVA